MRIIKNILIIILTVSAIAAGCIMPQVTFAIQDKKDFSKTENYEMIEDIDVVKHEETP